MNGKYFCWKTRIDKNNKQKIDFLYGKSYEYKDGYMHSTENGTDVMINKEELEKYWSKLDD